MDKFINADRIIKDIQNDNKENYNKKDWTSEQVVMLLKHAPAADVVPVIRCQNCKYKTSNGDVLYCRRGLTVIQNAKNYCNYGVTKDDENND